MNNKGFTLVELLAVIIILSLLALLASTSVTKVVRDSKSDLYNSQIQLIKSAAEAWGADNLDKIPEGGQCKYLTLKQLKEYGLLDSSIKNPKTNQEFSDDMLIKITSEVSKYNTLNTTYEVDANDVEGCTEAIIPICTLAENGDVGEEGITPGDKYLCKVKDDMPEGYENGYTFYVLSIEENKINLIMNTNLSGSTNWGNSTLNGPLSALEYLNSQTDNWNKISNLNETYTDEGKIYGSIQLTGKARLPKLEEINAVISDNKVPDWLIENLEYYFYPDYYWLLSTSNSNEAYVVYNTGYNGALTDADIGISQGCELDASWCWKYSVRPVIQVDLIEIFSSNLQSNTNNI